MANTGGGFIGIFMISITTRMEQMQEPTVIPSLSLLIGSPEVLSSDPNIFTIAQQKLLWILSYSLVINPDFPDNSAFVRKSSTIVSLSRCLRKSAFISMS